VLLCFCFARQATVFRFAANNWYQSLR
jgi:hypothetical protein